LAIFVATSVLVKKHIPKTPEITADAPANAGKNVTQPLHACATNHTHRV